MIRRLIPAAQGAAGFSVLLITLIGLRWGVPPVAIAVGAAVGAARLRVFSHKRPGGRFGVFLLPFLATAMVAATVLLPAFSVVQTLGVLLAAGLTAAALLQSRPEKAETPQASGPVSLAPAAFGAAAGALFASFYAFEELGLAITLVGAAGVLLAASAYLAVLGAPLIPSGEESSPLSTSPASPAPWQIAASGLSGALAALLLAVGLRLLAPLVVGATEVTRGIYLAVVFSGFGFGFQFGSGGMGSRGGRSLLPLAFILEAVAVAFPLALGEGPAVAAWVLRLMGEVGFGLQALAWGTLVGFLVLPVAATAGFRASLSGYRLPVAFLLGLAAGTVATPYLLPALGAVAVARAAALVAAALGVLHLCASRREESGLRRLHSNLPIAATLLLLLLLLLPSGPGALWRHGGIATGALPLPSTPAALEEALRRLHRSVVFEREGRTGAVAVHGLDGLAWSLDGHRAGHAPRLAAGRLGGVVVAAGLHPQPRRALILGLGDGSLAAGLLRLPELEALTVVEPEPVVVEVARRASALYPKQVAHLLDDPRLDLRLGDPRTFLRRKPQSDRRLDLIVSALLPLHRSDHAALLTVEAFAEAEKHLAPGGFFLQILPVDGLDSQAMRTLAATLATVFPAVEIWQWSPEELLLLASREPLDHAASPLPARLGQGPWRGIVEHILDVPPTPAGVYRAFRAAPAFAAAVRKLEEDRLHRDDRPVLEFRLARTLGREREFTPQRLAALAARRGDDRPPGLPPLPPAPTAKPPLETVSAAGLERIFRTAQQDPWSDRGRLEAALKQASTTARRDLFDVLEQPFALHRLDEARLRTRLEMARRIDFQALCLEVLAPFEPQAPWEADFLESRLRCYSHHRHGLIHRAEKELRTYRHMEPPSL